MEMKNKYVTIINENVMNPICCNYMRSINYLDSTKKDCCNQKILFYPKISSSDAVRGINLKDR
ncbi:hypothetical protein DERP_000309 [Dermatophagoides pteronyssinus]|uniref:Uncharacterized protein n=1 Tax=Dermatophagoides pteronyssinus TaxID=6956 RepID=A0ABQ8IZS9_DERPT|nr:hypothetical protein DERP_000309 [Dermatophagoides pteronyssinus]